MRDSAHAEKSHSSVLGMTDTRGAAEEKSPAVRVVRIGRGYKGGAGEVLLGAIRGSPALLMCP